MTARTALVASMLLLAGCGAGVGSGHTVVIEAAEVGGIFFLDSIHGWVVGSERKSRSLFIASTDDGGGSWSSIKIENKGRGFGNLTGVAFRDLTHGWAYGSHALAFATKDGGKTWEKQKAPGDIRTFRYRDGSGSLTLGPPGYSGRDGFFTFHNDDAGNGRLREKADVLNMFPHDVQIVDARTLWGFGDGSLYRSTDGGDSWNAIRVDEAYRGPSTIGDGVRGIFFLSPTTGFIVVGDRLLATTDAAATRRNLGPMGAGGFVFYQLHFFDEMRGVVLASTRESAAILATTDGGRTWSTKVDLGPGEWRELFVLDDTHAWAAGVVKTDVVVRPFAPQ
jgi:photosystem II stability/assembly factor-like uncharacterized protein